MGPVHHNQNWYTYIRFLSRTPQCSVCGKRKPRHWLPFSPLISFNNKEPIYVIGVFCNPSLTYPFQLFFKHKCNAIENQNSVLVMFSMTSSFDHENYIPALVIREVHSITKFHVITKFLSFFSIGTNDVPKTSEVL